MNSILSSIKARQTEHTPEDSSIPTASSTPEAPSPEAYKALELRQYARHDGSTVLPVDGWFDPKDQEDADLLAYYATKYNLVQAPKGK